MIAAMVKIDTGEIGSFMMPGNEADLYDGQVIGGLTVVWDRENVFGDNPGYGQHTHYYNGTAFIEKAESPSIFHVYNWTTHAWDWSSADFWQKVRADRDLKLSLSDWTQLPDSPITSEKRAEWVTYRAALRNVPANNSSVTELDNITWPNEPT